MLFSYFIKIDKSDKSTTCMIYKMTPVGKIVNLTSPSFQNEVSTISSDGTLRSSR